MWPRFSYFKLRCNTCSQLETVQPGHNTIGRSYLKRSFNRVISIKHSHFNFSVSTLLFTSNIWYLHSVCYWTRVNTQIYQLHEQEHDHHCNLNVCVIDSIKILAYLLKTWCVIDIIKTLAYLLKNWCVIDIIKTLAYLLKTWCVIDSIKTLAYLLKSWCVIDIIKTLAYLLKTWYVIDIIKH